MGSFALYLSLKTLLLCLKKIQNQPSEYFPEVLAEPPRIRVRNAELSHEENRCLFLQNFVVFAFRV